MHTDATTLLSAVGITAKQMYYNQGQEPMCGGIVNSGGKLHGLRVSALLIYNLGSNYGRRESAALTMRHPSIRKRWH
jgi:hypothetical protein